MEKFIERERIPEPHPLQPTTVCHLCVFFDYKQGKCTINGPFDGGECGNFIYKFKKKNKRGRK